jgi:hypothetical protein
MEEMLDLLPQWCNWLAYWIIECNVHLDFIPSREGKEWHYEICFLFCVGVCVHIIDISKNFQWTFLQNYAPYGHHTDLIINFLRLVVRTRLTWVEIRADAGIRNVFTADKNCLQARIADKTADMGLKQIILITVFYILEGRLCTTVPPKIGVDKFFSKIMCASLYSSVFMSGHFAFQHTLQDACFRAGGPVPNSAKLTLISWTGCSPNRYATHINDLIRSNPASGKHSLLDSR